jgi:hypothetical protein
MLPNQTARRMGLKVVPGRNSSHRVLAAPALAEDVEYFTG